MDTAQAPKSFRQNKRQTLCEPRIRVTLPTGETISQYQHLRRVQIPGFPATTEALPRGIQTEELIREWPNHLVSNCELYQVLNLEPYPGRPCSTALLRDSECFFETPILAFLQWGPLLLQLTAHWSPKQISNLSGGRLKSNSIVKRIKAARLQAGENQEQFKSQEKRCRNPRKRKRDADTGHQVREQGPNAEHLDVESEASRQFRISQMEIEEAVKAKDPNYELRQIGRLKKMPGLDRILIDQAVKERQENVTST